MITLLILVIFSEHKRNIYHQQRHILYIKININVHRDKK